MEDQAKDAIERVSVKLLPDGRMGRLDTARYLGVAEQTLAAWATRGIGPKPIRIGGRVFYRKAEVDAFIRAGEAA